MKKIFYSLIGIAILVACAKEQDQAQNNSNEQQEPQTATSKATDNQNDGTFSLYIDKTEVKNGEEICIDINGKNFKKIVSMQYTLRWDPNLLTFKRIEEFKIKALSAQNFNTTRASKGLLIKSWFDPAIQGITLDDDMPIYSLCFEAIGESGTESYIYFSGDPTIIEMSDPSGEINFKSDQSSIAIK